MESSSSPSSSTNRTKLAQRHNNYDGIKYDGAASTDLHDKVNGYIRLGREEETR